MKQKIFISYSHTDEEFMIQLRNHMSMMKNEGLVDEWNDRKLLPGQEWGKEISENLEASTIIILLVSSDFLASTYCFDIEMTRAMDMHESRKAVVVPIIIRSCDWSRAPFAKLQAMPKDANPVKKWSDMDDAWLDVAKKLRDLVGFLSTSVVSEKPGTGIDILPSFSEWLQDTNILLTHRRVSKVLLDDIYVNPDIRSQTKMGVDAAQIRSAFSVILESSHYLIFGEEQQGKTSLLKQAFNLLLKGGFTPVYIDASRISTSNLEKVVVKSAKYQYQNCIDPEDPSVVLLIDDFDKVKLNDRSRDKFLRLISDRYKHVVSTCSKSFSYVAPEIQELDEYQIFGLLRFGHEKRAEITERWVSLGVEEQISDEKMYRESDDLKLRLDSIIRGNIVPAKPIYVLMLLQMFEAYSQQNLKLTSHGHCYQELIYQSFRQSKIAPREVGSYLNILTELAWSLHKKGSGFLNNELDDFFNQYEVEYLKVDRVRVSENLQSNSILIVRDDRLKFKYPYLFYFFVAKKIAEGFSKSEEIRREISTLLNELHREDYANILVFVTHHTKDDWILDEIQITLMSLFEDQEQAGLESENLSFLDDFLSEIPSLVMEKRKISEERKKHHRRLDSIDEIPEDDSDDALENGQDETLETNDFLVKINKVFKGMEIAGQIVRNRHASLSRGSLYSLVEQGAGTGLRFLNYFVGISDTAKVEIVKIIEANLRDHPNLTDEQIKRIARFGYLQVTYGVINGVIKKIAASIGSKEAYEIYDQLEEQEATPAVMLLNRAISMHYKKVLNIDEIKQTARDLSGNAVCSRIFRELVIQHTYMFPVDYKEKQMLSEILDISVHRQRISDRQKETKS